MNMTLFDVNEALCEAWEREFEDYDDVIVVHSELTKLDDHDCLVSPANSFGLMDGGIDLHISNLIPDLQPKVSAYVADEWFGEQPVGTSLLVPTGFDRFPWLAHTPTMRFPKVIHPDAVYDAMRALLIAVQRHNEDEPDRQIETIACPGFGTATGGVGAQTAAKMMRVGYESIMVRDSEAYGTWEEVNAHIHEIYPGMGSAQ